MGHLTGARNRCDVSRSGPGRWGEGAMKYAAPRLSLAPSFSGLAFLCRWLRHPAIDVFQIAIEIAAGGQEQTGVLLERLLIRLQGLVKRIKLRVLAIRLGIDAGRFRVRLADDLLRFPIRPRAQAVQLALFLATNLGAGTVTF